MIAVVLGAPGSGKGTQSRLLSEKHRLSHVATGDILRSEIAMGTALGRQAEGYVKKGRLVPDELVTAMLAARIEQAPKDDYFLDGFPRNLRQAEELDKLLKRWGGRVDTALFLSLPASEALKRLSARQICTACGAVYNAITKPTRKPGVCDVCGGAVVARVDDAQETAIQRIAVYEKETTPLLDHYRRRGILREIDAAGEPTQISRALEAALADFWDHRDGDGNGGK